MGKKLRPRSVVLLTGYGPTGDIVIETSIPYEEYYDELNPLIDDDEYRARYGIRRLCGDIYNSSGELQSHFENEYDQTGAIIHGKAVHADGTVTET